MIRRLRGFTVKRIYRCKEMTKRNSYSIRTCTRSVLSPIRPNMVLTIKIGARLSRSLSWRTQRRNIIPLTFTKVVWKAITREIVQIFRELPAKCGVKKNKDSTRRKSNASLAKKIYSNWSTNKKLMILNLTVFIWRRKKWRMTAVLKNTIETILTKKWEACVTESQSRQILNSSRLQTSTSKTLYSRVNCEKIKWIRLLKRIRWTWKRNNTNGAKAHPKPRLDP